MCRLSTVIVNPCSGSHGAAEVTVSWSSETPKSSARSIWPGVWRLHPLFTHQHLWSVFPNLWYQCLMLFLQKNQFPCNRINIADFSLSYSPNALGYEWDPKVHKLKDDLFSERSHSFPPRGWFLSKHRRKNNTKKARNSFSCWQLSAYSMIWAPHVSCGWTGVCYCKYGVCRKKKNLSTLRFLALSGYLCERKNSQRKEKRRKYFVWVFLL